MTLPNEHQTEIERQFKQGYDWFGQRTGYDFPAPGRIDLCALNPKAWPAGSDDTGFRIEIENGKLTIGVYFGSQKARQYTDTKHFVSMGSRAAFCTYRYDRHGVKQLRDLPNPGNFVCNLAYREINGKMCEIVSADREGVFTTADFVRIAYPAVRSVITEDLTNEVRRVVEEGMKKSAQPYSPEMVEQMTAKTIDSVVLDSISKTDIYRKLAPCLDANDLVSDFSSGNEDPSLVAPFLRFLSDELYDPQERVQKLFLGFKASRAQ